MLVRFRRRWVYCLPKYTTNEDNTTKENSLTTKDTPPPTHFASRVELVPENTTGKEEEVVQQQFNTDSTVVQQPQNVEFKENASTVDDTIDTKAQEVIQHTSREEGERGCVEQTQFDDVLQTEPAINSSTTCSTQIETSSPTSSLA